MSAEFGIPIPEGLSVQIISAQIEGKSRSGITLLTSERKITRGQGGHPVTKINATAEKFEGFEEAIHIKGAESRLRRALHWVEVGVAYASGTAGGNFVIEAITEGKPEFIGFAVICFTAGVLLLKEGDRNSKEREIASVQLQALKTTEESFALNQMVDDLQPPNGDISRN